MNLQSENHSVQVLDVLQKKNRNGCDILLIGNDNVISHSDNLWILSPLVRSIIDSLGNIRDNQIILPDFSYEDLSINLQYCSSEIRSEIRISTLLLVAPLQRSKTVPRSCYASSLMPLRTSSGHKGYLASNARMP